ncbi:MAG: hypothetical protein GY733_14940, partial [bacterium]|nr:hypothetical protein [bacterium]
MHRPPPRPGPRRRTLRRTILRPSVLAMGGIALLSLTGFGDAPEANEVETVRRSGDVGQYEPIPIESLPVHHSADAPIVADHQRAALDPELRQAATRKSAARRPTAPRMPAPKASRADAGVDLMTSPLGLSVIKGKLSRGQSIAGVLRRRGISPQMVRMIDRALRPEFDFRRAQPGDSFRLSRDMDGRLVSFRYRASPDESFVLRQSPRGYVVERVESVLYRRMTRMEGTVDSSLYKSIRGLGH